MLRRLAVAACALNFGTLASARPCRAQAELPLDVAAESDDSWRLEYLAPLGCPSAQEFRSLVNNALGHGTGSGSDLSVQVQITSAGGAAYSLELRTSSTRGSGERQLTADGCSELSKAAAAVIALSQGTRLRSEPQAPNTNGNAPNEPSPSTAQHSSETTTGASNQPQNALAPPAPAESTRPAESTPPAETTRATERTLPRKSAARRPTARAVVAPNEPRLATPTPQPSPMPSPAARWQVGVGWRVLFGALPKPAPELTIHAGRRWKAIEVGAALGGTASKQTVAATTQPVFTQAVLHAHTAYVRNLSQRVSWGGALEFSGAVNRARGDDALANNTTAELGLSPLLDLVLTEQWHVRLSGGLQLALRRAELSRGSAPFRERIWREPLLNATAGASLFFTF